MKLSTYLIQGFKGWACVIPSLCLPQLSDPTNPVPIPTAIAMHYVLSVVREGTCLELD